MRRNAVLQGCKHPKKGRSIGCTSSDEMLGPPEKACLEVGFVIKSVGGGELVPEGEERAGLD